MLTHAEVLARSADSVAAEFVRDATADHDVIAPKIPAIRATITDRFTRERERRASLTADHPHAAIPTFFELTWRDCTIVEKETRARLAEVHRVTMQEGSTSKVLSVDEWR